MFELRAVAAFRREAASGNRGPTLKQPRCRLNLRDQRRTHCLSCLAVFQARGAEGVTKPSGAEGVTNSCAATAGVGAMPLSRFDEALTAQARFQPNTVTPLRPLVSLPL